MIARKDELKRDVDYLHTVVSQLQEELDLMRPELVELRKKRENYHMWLVQRGENDDSIQSALKTSENESVAVDQVRDEDTSKLADESQMHSNSLNWYRADCDREKAIELLEAKENGTYLVRLSSKPGFKYVLSVMAQNVIKHLPIEENQTGCFLKSSQKRLKNRINASPSNSSNNSRAASPAFLNSTESLIKSSASANSISSINSVSATKSDDSIANKSSQEATLKFKTLTDLIVFYSENPLVADNIYLDTKLTNPVFFGKNLS